MSMSNKLAKLKQRRTDPDTLTKATFDSYFFSNLQESTKRSFEALGLNEDLAYVLESMKEVESKYNEKTIEEANRVINQLMKQTIGDVDFCFQGSVTNNTHIKYASDIDILVINKDFISLEPPLVPQNPYQGNPVEELRKTRNYCAKVLVNAFPTADVDQSGSKSIAIQNGSLRRKIDVVPCNWYHTVQYSQTQNKIYLGVKVLDNKNSTRIDNLPFLHNYRIDEKDMQTGGNFRKIVRLIKSIKNDIDDNVNVSSYEISSLIYNIPNSKIYSLDNPLDILITVADYFMFIISEKAELSKLKSPNGLVKIIDTLNVDELKKIISEILTIAKNIQET